MARIDLSSDKQQPRDIDAALRKLKRLVDRCGTLKTLASKESYENPTTKRKRKAAAARARQRREAAKNELPHKQH